MSTDIPDLGIHYLNKEVEELYKQNGGIMESKSAGFDLLTTEDIYFDRIKPLKSFLIPLGLVIKIPEGYYAEIVPRSSTYKKYGLVQSNSVGIIDESYCGEEDQLFWSAIKLRHVSSSEFMQWKYRSIEEDMEWFPNTRKPDIVKGTRLCQLLLKPVVRFNAQSFNPSSKSRGGFGSTGD